MMQHYWIPDARPPLRNSRLAKLLAVLGRRGEVTLKELGRTLYKNSAARARRSVENLIARGFPAKFKGDIVTYHVPKKYFVTKEWVRKFKTWRL